LRSYQERAVERIYEYDTTLVDAKMGAGKTAIASTAAAELLRDGVVSRVLVLAPANVARFVWPTEAAIWAPDWECRAAAGTPKQRARILASDTPIVSMSLDVLPWAAREQLLRGFDMLIIDESTWIADATTARFKALMKVRPQFKVVVGLTGTLMGRGLLGLYGQVTAVDGGKRWSTSFYRWRKRLFDSDYQGHKWEPKPGTHERLLREMRDLVWYIEPDTLDAELPDVVTDTIRVGMPASVRREYERLGEDFVLALETGDTILAGSADTLTGKLRQLSGGFLYNEAGEPVWRFHGKMDAAAQALQTMGANCLVLYEYIAELEAMQARVPGATIHDRGVIDAWNRGGVPVLYAHRGSVGHGLNLQHGGNALLWLSLPWSWEQYEQARARLIRPGQRNTVMEHIMLVSDTIDDAVLGSLQAQRNTAADVADYLKRHQDGR